MSPDFIIHLGQQTFLIALKLTAPILAIGLLVGLLVSIFQATTQIQEQTLAFIPKIVAVLVSILFFGPWMLTTLIDFTQSILGNLISFVR